MIAMPLMYYFLVILLIWRIAMSLRVKNITLKTHYQLLKLQDRLKWQVVDGHIDSNNYIYKAVEERILASAYHVNKLNFWVILYLTLSKKQERIDKDQLKEIEIIEHELHKYPEVNKIYKEYVQLSLNYLIEKSKFTIFGVAFIAFAIKFVLESFNVGKVKAAFRKKENKFKHVLVYSETTFSFYK